MGATTVVQGILETDRQFERRMRTLVAVDVHIHHACAAIGVTLADAAQHMLEDVDVMFSAIEAAHGEK